MVESFGNCSDEKMIEYLSNIIENVLYTSHEELNVIVLLGYVEKLSDILNVSIEQQTDDKEGTIKWTDRLFLSVMDSRYDDFCDMIKQELVLEERYMVIVELEKLNLL